MNKFTLEDARKALKIDRNDLYFMCLIHSEVFEHVTEALAKAIDRRDTLKDSLNVVMAKEIKNLRAYYADKGEKVTEARLEQEAILTSNYREAFRKYMEAKEEADIWQGVKEAFMQRGRALKDVCKMQLDIYSSQITVKTNDIEEVSYALAKKGMNDKRNKRKELKK